MVRLPTIGVQFGKLPYRSKSRARIDNGIRLKQAQFFLQGSRHKLLESLAAACCGSLGSPEQGLGHLQRGFRGAHMRAFIADQTAAIMTHKYGFGQKCGAQAAPGVFANQLFETLEEWNDYLER
jgi:hypothetical protein